MARTRALSEVVGDVTPPVPESPVQQPEPAPTPPERSMRLSVDLPQSVYESLTQWSFEAGRAVGKSKVPAAQVARACIQHLLADNDWKQEVIADLRKGK